MTNETPVKAAQKAKLTPMQRTFVKVAAGTGDQTYAAYRAGYADPVVAGSKLMAKAHIHESVMETQFRRIRDDLVVKAFDTYDEVLSNKDLPHNWRLKAADKVTDTALKLREEAAANKDLSLMSAAELAALSRGLERSKMLIRQLAGEVDDAEAVEILPDQGVFS